MHDPSPANERWARACQIAFLFLYLSPPPSPPLSRCLTSSSHGRKQPEGTSSEQWHTAVYSLSSIPSSSPLFLFFLLFLLSSLSFVSPLFPLLCTLPPVFSHSYPPFLYFLSPYSPTVHVSFLLSLCPDSYVPNPTMCYFHDGNIQLLRMETLSWERHLRLCTLGVLATFMLRTLSILLPALRSIWNRIMKSWLR